MTIKLNFPNIRGSIRELVQDTNRPKGTTSSKRLNDPQKILNERLQKIADDCLARDNTKIFHQPVKKKEAPDYLLKIVNPMDLGTIRNKTKRWGTCFFPAIDYTTLEGFRKDIELVRSNAEKFNGPLHFLAVLAKEIEAFAIGQLEA